MSVTIEAVAAPTPEVRALITELDRQLSAHYAAEQRHAIAFDAIFQPHIRFFLARLDGVAVGCGGVAIMDGYSEVKRMFVQDMARGRGVAQALLGRIETAARQSGSAWLRLETGDQQAAAMRLYAAAGFRPCGAFGPYAAMPAAATVTSVYFEKELSPAAA